MKQKKMSNVSTKISSTGSMDIVICLSGNILYIIVQLIERALSTHIDLFCSVSAHRKTNLLYAELVRKMVSFCFVPFSISEWDGHDYDIH